METNWDNFRLAFFSAFFKLELHDCKHDLDRISAIFDVHYDQLMQFDLHHSKSCKDSGWFNHWKAKGNSYLSKGEYFSAITAYTRALFFAKTTPEKAIAYGNRSAVLLQVNFPKESLRDIDACLANDYPLNKRFRLLNRAGECHLMLRRRDDAKAKFSESLSLLDDGHYDLSEGQRDLWRARIAGHLEHLDKESEIIDNPDNLPRTYDCVRPKLPRVTGEVNTRITSASDAIEIKISDVDGRGLYAKRDLQTGEYLAVEVPYAKCVIPERYHTHCYCCTYRSLTLVPCRSCTVVGYCSDACETEAWNSYHKFECPVVDHLDVLPNLRMVRLAYRTVISTERETVLRIASHNSKFTKDCGDCEEFEIFDSADYACAYSIIANSSRRERDDMTDRALLAVFLLLCAMKSGFLSGQPPDRMEAALVATAFLRHLQSLPCNAHEINEEYVPTDGNLTEAELQEIASGLFPLLSLVNHSCDPNIHRVCFEGGACSLIAVRPISAGEQLLDCYSQHFAVNPRDERQRYLNEQYLFDCRCHACVHDWPQYEALCEIIYPALKIPELSDEDGRKWQRASESRDEFMELLAQGRKKFCEDNKAEKFFIDYQTLLGRIIKRPWKEMNNNEECLKILWNLKGNLFQDHK